MNKKGQALIEFIIILPVIIYLFLAIIDYSIIIFKKNDLESKINEIVKLYKNNSIEEINTFLNHDNKDIIFDTVKEDKYTKILLKMKVDFITPGTNIILDNPYYIKCERVILYE